MTPTPPPSISESVDICDSAADKERRYVSFMHLFVPFWKHISPVHPIRMIKWHLPSLACHAHTRRNNGPGASGKRIDHSIKRGKPLLRLGRRAGKDIRRHKSVALHFAPVVIAGYLSVFPRNSYLESQPTASYFFFHRTQYTPDVYFRHLLFPPPVSEQPVYTPMF